MALLSILGMYNYDSSVMEGFNVPENVDRDTVVNSILLDCAELELIYSNIDIMKLAIATWSDKELPIWTKLQKTNELEYNPIYNLDVKEKETETRALQKTDSAITSANSSGNTVDSVHGFNSTDWADSNMQDSSANSSGSTNGTSTDTGTVIHEYQRAGNQGVTSTQQMIREEREVASFNIIDYIVKSFKRRFCLGVY